ncbi:zinc metalloprotease HtpX [Tumebacillus permanentifrigoris]|uniref:Protease HtpX homolog n=1 Tax=Tumebacillus permanentifrigoris TaxID=378543 RepID=A0A316D9S1_9BACL|nr:zinc metalloprotease HtpX [Tumebacillus permanentifrigoris]PWK13918.1 heat shock protein [Tumebacillus permanentifrigoris]
MNTLKTWFLMALLTVLMVLMGSLIGGRGGATLFLLMAIGINFFSYWFSASIAIRMTRSRELSEQEAPQLFHIMYRLTQNAGLPMPKLYLQPSPQPNAFATGRNPANSAVAVTEGILQILSPEELEGVLAHELAHIKNRDVLISTLAAIFAGAITWISNALQWTMLLGGSRDDEDNPLGIVGTLVMMIVGPIAALLIQMAISRSREYKADALGAQICGNPHALANALVKLEQAAHHIPPIGMQPSTSHLMIVFPFKGSGLTSLFSTHPPIQERVSRLRGMRF